ncbi:MAG: adenylosuccinate lyase, partial [Dehalococcoidia bacterium]|nr:adenylosuccinate lyase [Dehalococcoidia bacterium]
TERIILPDSCLVMDYVLYIFTYIMKGLQVYPERMKQNMELTKGLVFSQRVMLTLIEKGLSREEAYRMVQGNAMQAWKDRGSFLDLLVGDPEVGKHLSKAELEGIFDYAYFIRHVDAIFERLGLV